MARNSTLGAVRAMFKAETQKSLQTTSTTQDPEINQIIYNVQQWLASEYDWPFLRCRWDVTIPPGVAGRYNAFPVMDDNNLTTAINFERAGALQVFVLWNTIWQEVIYGIREQEEFNYLNSDLGQVLNPIQRWMFDDENMFEIWPLAASTQTVRFVGQRVVSELRALPLVVPPNWNDLSTLDLDDLMVVYFAAAEYALREEREDVAKYLLEAGNTRMAQIRRTYPILNTQPVIVGGSTTFSRRTLRLVPIITVGGK